MNYSEFLNKDGAKILITGDSLSFNHYGYDPPIRNNNNAFDYGVGMQSWSFALRDRLYFEDENFIFGNKLNFNCKATQGIDNDCKIPYTAAFGGKVMTLYPEKEVAFEVPFCSEQIVLYLQNRIDNPCVFDVVVDDKVVLTDVDTMGDESFFAGYGLSVLPLPCDKKSNHTVKFLNIRGKNPKITVAAVGSVYREITLNGRGGEKIRFFIENFEERIGKFNPDLIIISLTANDRIKIAPEAVRVNLLEMFSMIFGRFPKVKILFLTPPNTHDPMDEGKDMGGFSSLITAETYNRAVERVCAKLGDEGYNDFGLKSGAKHNIEVMRMSALFDDNDVTSWRIDNVHLNPNGNQILYNALLDKFELKKDL
ncbi:MAG: SGNH/GDSL hydrolase family protein [Clostridia bacterium]|nr:SGNH/GDSL hydrolase family protein [Clostridia bacterium]